jgi:Domain of unknown function (DUF4349)
VSPLELVDDRFEQLASELRAAKPSVSPRLRQRVEVLARVEAEEPKQRFRPRIMWGRSAKRLLVVCAVVAIAVPLVGAGVQGLHDNLNSQPTPRAVVGKNPAPQVTTGRAGEKDLATPSLQQRLKAAPSTTANRLQQYDATLRLRVKDVDALSSATQRAMRVTRGVGGYVAAVQYSTKAGRRGGANLVLRVPTATVSTALERLSALGTILGQHVAILDVQRRADRQTKEIARLAADVTELQDLLAATALPRANQAQLQHRLTVERRALAALRAQQTALLKRAHLAKINLRLTTTAEGAAGRFSKTLDDAGSVLVKELQVLLYALIVVGPLLALGGIAIAVGRAQRRRSDRRLLERT